MPAKIFHPLLALIASASNNELARYVEFLKEENKILRSRIRSQALWAVDFFSIKAVTALRFRRPKLSSHGEAKQEAASVSGGVIYRSRPKLTGPRISSQFSQELTRIDSILYRILYQDCS